jgi:hypothetical protein
MGESQMNLGHLRRFIEGMSDDTVIHIDACFSCFGYVAPMRSITLQQTGELVLRDHYLNLNNEVTINGVTYVREISRISRAFNAGKR